MPPRDSVLGTVVRRFLVRRFPSADEGRLTALEARLTSSAALYEYALILNLQRYVVESAPLMRSCHHYSPGVLEDCLEALLGALYLDQGLPCCEQFVLSLIDRAMGLETLDTEGWDFK